jgi:hypothetical protein
MRYCARTPATLLTGNLIPELAKRKEKRTVTPDHDNNGI